MVFETLIAASIYTGAITYLHHDGPAIPTATLENQAQVHTTAAASYKQRESRSFSTTPSTQNADIDPDDLRGESIWAKDDGKFEEWAK
jgi:hypothetical protein